MGEGEGIVGKGTGRNIRGGKGRGMGGGSIGEEEVLGGGGGGRGIGRRKMYWEEEEVLGEGRGIGRRRKRYWGGRRGLGGRRYWGGGIRGIGRRRKRHRRKKKRYGRRWIKRQGRKKSLILFLQSGHSWTEMRRTFSDALSKPHFMDNRFERFAENKRGCH